MGCHSLLWEPKAERGHGRPSWLVSFKSQNENPEILLWRIFMTQRRKWRPGAPHFRHFGLLPILLVFYFGGTLLPIGISQGNRFQRMLLRNGPHSSCWRTRRPSMHAQGCPVFWELPHCGREKHDKPHTSGQLSSTVSVGLLSKDRAT